MEQTETTTRPPRMRAASLATDKHNIRFNRQDWRRAVEKAARIGGSMSSIFQRALDDFLNESDRESSLRLETRMAEHYRRDEVEHDNDQAAEVEAELSETGEPGRTAAP